MARDPKLGVSVNAVMSDFRKMLQASMPTELGARRNIADGAR
jgi:hypothetical protein